MSVESPICRLFFHEDVAFKSVTILLTYRQVENIATAQQMYFNISFITFQR